jgi:predicted Fe-Mo cluster-binding NifX family protein
VKIVVTSNGLDLGAEASPVFGRCPAYVFVDTETMDFEAAENPAVGASGGAGIQAAQFIAERGAQAVVTGNVGPNAFGVLQAAGVAVYLYGGGTVKQAVEAFKAGQLSAQGGPSAAAHAGMRSMYGAGMGSGRGQGMGRGRGMGMGMGVGAYAATPPAPPTPPPTAGDQDLAELKDLASDLRRQLADVMDRLDRLEKGE